MILRATQDLVLPMNLLVVVLIAAVLFLVYRTSATTSKRAANCCLLIAISWAVSIPYLYEEVRINTDTGKQSLEEASSDESAAVIAKPLLRALRYAVIGTAFQYWAAVYWYASGRRRTSMLLAAVIVMMSTICCLLLAQGRVAHPPFQYYVACTAFVCWSVGGVIVLVFTLPAVLKEISFLDAASARLVTYPLWVFASAQVLYVPLLLPEHLPVAGVTVGKVKEILKPIGFLVGFATKTVHLAGILRHVTRHAISLSTLAASRDAISRRTRLFSKALHELKTPTTELGMLLERYERDLVVKQNAKLTSAATAGAIARVLAIIEGAFEIVNVDKLDTRLSKDIDVVAKLPTLVEAAALVVRSTYPVIENVDVLVEHDCHYSGNVTVRCRRFEIIQALINLMRNAYDAMMPGGGTLRLVVKWDKGPDAQQDARIAVIVVEDDGQGIAADNLGRIWDDEYTTREPRNMRGHGLAVALDLVGRNGGVISVQSPPAGKSRGTAFEIRFDSVREQRGD